MEDQEQGTKARVVKVESKESWDFHVNQATVQGSPIVAHFTAAWCIPSVAMNPYMEELASMYQNTISILTIDVDEVKEVASKYEVKAMPTFLLLKDGVPVDKLVGANPDEIRKRVQSLAQSNPTDIA
ncbi:PREDICTED: thioredoxin-like protein CXXS1 [Nicotiana attenuata]|uniref:Thioredoxin-like protein cxxs1 n=1 Tax=Nicotiana attenuata TaxID=49451 RepID=A0A1J6JSX4_NICAT|nr:PREDICTED: thioredoxin-like protein CXXS1 [Nicotiana attenuata]OIT20837.1 thioredoxin-like protein cxxs1 [Nicotiana attenuata]